jgi:hypothetical protein
VISDLRAEEAKPPASKLYLFLTISAPLLPGFVRITQADIDNEVVWFNVLSQDFTAAAHVEGVLQHVEDWEEIQKQLGFGAMILWLGNQPSCKCGKYLTSSSCWQKNLHQAAHHPKGEDGSTS